MKVMLTEKFSSTAVQGNSMNSTQDFFKTVEEMIAGILNRI